ncbi:unnamed protein product, partial [Mesorhabditis spiculigera]
MFYGHTHFDEFQIFYDGGKPKGRPTHFAWIAPSLTTYSDHNPAYRIYTVDGEYDGSSYTVADAATYWTDIELANKNNQEPIWKLEYDTRKGLNMHDLSPKSWEDLVQRMEADNALFDKYRTYRFRNAAFEKDCVTNPECRKKMICSLRSARSMFVVLGYLSCLLLIQSSASAEAPQINKDAYLHNVMDRIAALTPSNADLGCGTCKLLVDMLQNMLKSNKTEQEIFEVVENLCVNLKIEDPHICKAIVPQFGPELVYVLEKSDHDVDDICGAMITGCGNPENPKTALWPMQIPANKPVVKPWPVVANGGNTLRVLHLSDIHLDRMYTVGAESNCTKGGGVQNPMCCRPYPDVDPSTPIQIPAGPWGMNQNCDLPFQTFVNAMSHINKTEKLDFIYITGDLEGHDIWDYTKEKTISNIQNITDVLSSFFPNTPIYQATGNHEGVPMDGMPPHTMEDYQTYSPEWLYKEFAKAWGPHLTQQAIFDTQYRASYSIYIKKNLRLISLNTVYCSQWNFFLFLDLVDPDGTLQWLAEQLLDAEQKKEKVHIISHIPSGDDYCMKGWSFNFYDIVNRIYTIDGEYTGSSYTVLEAETYWADVELANRNNKEPDWKLEYKTRQAYNMPDLSPKSWSDLVTRMETNNTLFNMYRTYHYRNPNHEKNCATNGNCKQNIMARGHQKALSQQRNAQKQEAAKKGTSQAKTAQAALKFKCSVCMAQMPDPITYKDHFTSKHPKSPLPAELQA